MAKEKRKSTFFAEFKKFIARGNVMDMAVGVIVGGAFGKISTSLVNDIIMPLVSLLIGGFDFSDWKLVLRPAVVDASTGAEVASAITLNFGLFLSTVLNFIIIAFAVFCMVRFINSLHRRHEQPAPQPEPEPEPEPSPEEVLLTEIRDLLKEQSHGRTE